MEPLNQEVVTKVLNSPAALSIKTFFVGGNMITGSFYQALAAQMSMFECLNVLHYPNLKGASAMYDSGSNALLLRFKQPGSPTETSLIIHEATHAICDMLQMNISVMESEMMAYIAQCQFYRGLRQPSRLWSQDAKKDAVFEFATNIAEALQAGTTPSSQDFESLRQAVTKHPYYKNSYGKSANYDGI